MIRLAHSQNYLAITPSREQVMRLCLLCAVRAWLASVASLEQDALFVLHLSFFSP